jgi:UDP-galactopyranose mutase
VNFATATEETEKQEGEMRPHAGNFDCYRLVVVGSGFFGSVVAHCAATELGVPVLLVDKRSHVGGNSYSELDPETGIEYHRYGTHIFHTSNTKVWQFVNRFTAFNNYRHRVFAVYQGKTYTLPINLMTINNFFGKSFTPEEAKAFVECEIRYAAPQNPRNLEEKAISLVGRRLYEAFIRGYTSKQWETDPQELPPDIISRLPVRFSYNDFYFSDLYEGIPTNGYYKIFEGLLAPSNIRVELNCDYLQICKLIPEHALVIYTGAIDRFYDYQYGNLGWRTLNFELERPNVADYQGAAVINYSEPQYPYTRIHEFKHLHPERPQVSRTLIMREYSRFAGRADEPYYPIGTSQDKKCYAQYRELADLEDRVLFGGRLGSYRYYDMHQAIAAALKCFNDRIAPWVTEGLSLRKSSNGAEKSSNR